MNGIQTSTRASLDRRCNETIQELVERVRGDIAEQWRSPALIYGPNRSDPMRIALRTDESDYEDCKRYIYKNSTEIQVLNTRGNAYLNVIPREIAF